MHSLVASQTESLFDFVSRKLKEVNSFSNWMILDQQPIHYSFSLYEHFFGQLQDRYTNIAMRSVQADALYQEFSVKTSYGSFDLVFAAFDSSQIENTRIYAFKVRAMKGGAAQGVLSWCKSRKGKSSVNLDEPLMLACISVSRFMSRLILRLHVDFEKQKNDPVIK